VLCALAPALLRDGVVRPGFAQLRGYPGRGPICRVCGARAPVSRDYVKGPDTVRLWFCAKHVGTAPSRVTGDDVQNVPFAQLAIAGFCCLLPVVVGVKFARGELAGRGAAREEVLVAEAVLQRSPDDDAAKVRLAKARETLERLERENPLGAGELAKVIAGTTLPAAAHVALIFAVGGSLT
jgi:hypothetical protein